MKKKFFNLIAACCLMLLSGVSFAKGNLEQRAKKIEDVRTALSPNLSSDDQFEKFRTANKTLCEDLQKNPVIKAGASGEYLDQVLFLTARLLKIDAGKTVMDCFAVYYEKNEALIVDRVKSWKSKDSIYLDSKKILEENLKEFQTSSDFRSTSEKEPAQNE